LRRSGAAVIDGEGRSDRLRQGAVRLVAIGDPADRLRRRGSRV